MGSLEKLEDTGDDSLSCLTPVARELRLSATLEINELVAKQRAAGRRVVHLGFGEATFPLPAEVLAAHQRASQITNYLPVAGLPKLREAVAAFQTRRLGGTTTIRPEQVVIAPGSKPLLFALFDVLAGDVLLPRPSWVSYEPQVRHAGKRLFWVETDAADRHTITPAALAEAYDGAVAAGGNPRIMLINSPSNPTGCVFSEAQLALLARFCAERGVALISDEIYGDIYYGDAGDNDNTVKSCTSAGSAGRFTTGKMILTGGLSKTYSAGGWRVGFVVLPPTEFGATLRTALLAYASECWSAASAPAQEAAAVAFGTTPAMDSYRARVTRMHGVCTLRLYTALKRMGLAVPRPQGAFYVYPSFQPFAAQLAARGVHTSTQLARWLIEECGVAALPGCVFGEQDEDRDEPDNGGRFRLRMATSYLYFRDQDDRYTRGYELLERASTAAGAAAIDLPLLDEAIAALQGAVAKLRATS